MSLGNKCKRAQLLARKALENTRLGGRGTGLRNTLAFRPVFFVTIVCVTVAARSPGSDLGPVALGAVQTQNESRSLPQRASNPNGEDKGQERRQRHGQQERVAPVHPPGQRLLTLTPVRDP